MLRAILLIATLFPPGLVLGYLLGAHAHEVVASPPQAAQQKGPWGTLELTRILVGPPAGIVTPEQCRTLQPTWQFPGASRAKVLALLDSAGLNQQEREALEHAMVCDGNRGCSIAPPSAVVASLSPASRRVLYDAVEQEGANARQMYLYRRDAADGEWSARDGFTEEMLGWMQPLLYHRGDWTLFADPPPVCSRLSSDAEKVRFMEALMQRPAVEAWLRVGPESDLDTLVRYWQPGSRHKELRPLLESLARVPGGGRIDILNLLPRFVRYRLNTYSNPGAAPASCAWTALNFFDDDAPTEGLVSLEEFEDRLKRDFTTVSAGDKQLGDLLVFRDRSGRIAHAVNYVAGGLVFTKNGTSFRRPWVLSTLDEMQFEYPFAREVTVYRRR